MMTDPSSQPPDADTFADLIQNYAADSRYGERWATEVAPGLLQKLLVACETKDFGYLRHLRFPENVFLRAVFARLTGIALPRTQRESLHILQEYVGPQSVEAFEQEKARERQQRQLERLERQLTSLITVDHYGLLQTGEFIRRLLADGYTNLSERQRGVAKEWFLCNAQHTGYIFRRRIERDYIAYLLEQCGPTEEEGHDA